MPEYSNSEIKHSLGSISSFRNRTTYSDNLAAVFDNGARINTYIVIWAAGVGPDDIFGNIPCDKDR